MLQVIKEIKNNDGTDIIYKLNDKIGYYHRTKESRNKYVKDLLRENRFIISMFTLSVLVIVSLFAITLPLTKSIPEFFLVNPEEGWGDSDLRSWGFLALFHFVLAFAAFLMCMFTYQTVTLLNFREGKRDEIYYGGDRSFFAPISISLEKLVNYIESLSDQQIRELFEECATYKKNQLLIDEITKTLREKSTSKIFHLRIDLQNKLEGLKEEQQKHLDTFRKYEQAIQKHSETLKEEVLSEEYLRLLAS